MITKEEYIELERMLDGVPDDVHRAQMEAYIYGIRDCVMGGDKEFFIKKINLIPK